MSNLTLDNTKLITGAEQLFKAVSMTAGPMGKTILIEKESTQPYLTKDGVTVAEAVKCEDPIEQLGCSIIREAAQNTVNQAGDGTTLTTVLAYYFMLALSTNTNPNIYATLRELEEDVNVIINALVKSSKKVKSKKECIAIAKIATNDEFLGNQIGEIMWLAKDNGTVQFEMSETGFTYVEQETGSFYVKTNPLHQFLGTFGNNITYDNPYIILLEDGLNSIDEATQIISEAFTKNQPCVIFAKGYSNPVIQFFTINVVKGGKKILPLLYPGYEEELNDYKDDIQAIVDDGLIYRINATTKGFTFYTDQGENVQQRIKYLNAKANTLPKYLQVKMLSRISNLDQNVYTLYVGAESAIERDEIKDRVEDGLLACKSALEDGYVIGAGMSLYHLSHLCKNDIVKQVLKEPALNILKNAHLEPIEFQEGQGFNSSTGEVVDLMKNHIIDPTRVIKSALKNSFSVAKTIVTLGGILTHVKDDTATI